MTAFYWKNIHTILLNKKIKIEKKKHFAIIISKNHERTIEF